MAVLFFAWNISCVPDKSESNQAATRIVHEIALKGGDGSDLSNHLEPQMFGGRFFLKEHAVPPCLVLVIDDNLYGLMVSLSYI